MVPVFKLLSRCAHIICTILLFALSIAPLFSPPEASSATNGKPGFVLYFGGGTVVVNPSRISMILVVVMIVSGLYNAHTMKVGTTLAHSIRDRVSWRMHVYFLKGMMLLSLSPLLEYGIEWFSERNGGAKAFTDLEKKQTAALTRAYVILLMAGVGSYSKIIRENSIQKHNEAQQKKEKDNSPTAAGAKKHE